MDNFNIRYECLDARDNYRAQMKKETVLPFASSWEENNTNDNDFGDEGRKDNDEIDSNDMPVNLLTIGRGQHDRIMQMEMMKNILRNTGWTHEIAAEKNPIPSFIPGCVLPGCEWKAEVAKKHQEIQDK